MIGGRMIDGALDHFWHDRPTLDVSWRDRGACRDSAPATFFPHRPEEVRHAKAICAQCPVMERCGEYAIHHEIHGVWGGMSELQRKKIRRARGISVERPEVAIEAEMDWAGHGTAARYGRHLRDGEKACAACRAAHAAEQAERTRRRKVAS